MRAKAVLARGHVGDEPSTDCKVEEFSLRPIDLARRAGVSVQTVRRYERAGFLPAASRLPGGHRRFTARHLAALLAMTELSAAHGHGVAARIMRAVAAGDIADAMAVFDSAHAALDLARQRAIAVLEILHDGTGDTAMPSGATRLRIGPFSELAEVPVSTVRFWEHRGLLAPERDTSSGYRVFGPNELRRAGLIQAMRTAGFDFDDIATVLEALESSRQDDAARVVDAALRRLSSRSATSLRAAARVLQADG